MTKKLTALQACYVLGYRRALRRAQARHRVANARPNQKVDELEAATRALAVERRAIRDELRFLVEIWNEQLADLLNIITDFERKYFEGLRARSTLATSERDDSTRLH